MKTSEFSLIIPVYNEDEIIHELYTRLTAVMKDVAKTYELIFINDGSADNTLENLKALAEKDHSLKIITLSRNFGHQSALAAGLAHASAKNAVMVIDGDLQDPPEILNEFIHKWREGYKVVYGIRTHRKESLLLRSSYKLFYWLLRKFSHIDIPVDAGDFCLMDRKVVDIMKSLPEHMRFIRGLRAWIGFQQTGVPYERCGRQYGRSKYSLRALVHLALDGFYSFSALPIHMIFWFSMALAVLSCCGIVLLIAAKLFLLYDVPGWTSLFVAMLFFGSIQLLAISIVGEYCGKIFEETKRRPAYIVKSFVNINTAADIHGEHQT